MTIGLIELAEHIATLAQNPKANRMALRVAVALLLSEMEKVRKAAQSW